MSKTVFFFIIASLAAIVFGFTSVCLLAGIHRGWEMYLAWSSSALACPVSAYFEHETEYKGAS